MYIYIYTDWWRWRWRRAHRGERHTYTRKVWWGESVIDRRGKCAEGDAARLLLLRLVETTGRTEERDVGAVG